MEFQQLWRDYKELMLVVATAAATLTATLLGQKVLPGLGQVLGRLFGRLAAKLSKRFADARFQRQYVDWLCRHHRYLNMRGFGLFVPPPMELEEVYISLSLGRQHRGARDPRQGADSGARLEAGEALQRHLRVVLLGGPGSGKTTLLQYLLLRFARGEAQARLGLKEERLPIYLPLERLVRMGRPLTAEELPALCLGPHLQEECPPDFFRKRLEDGRCILLLDGLDEVTTDRQRREVADQINHFVSRYHLNRFVITARPTGYTGVALAGFHQLDVCELREEDIRTFARQWCRAVVRAVGGEGAPPEGLRLAADQEAAELVGAIQSNDHVRRLAVNPLLLTIVAIIHRSRIALPNRRVELYDACTQVLLGVWDESKSLPDQPLDWSRRRRLLEHLAYAMQQQRLSRIEAPAAERVLGAVLPSVGRKEKEAAEQLKHMRERSGLVVEPAPGTYGFSHPTFQEYLTARNLYARGVEGREELLRRRHDPWWLEVTLLYAAMSSDSALIDAILTAPEDLFRSNLLLAARCLTDMEAVEPRVQERVISELVALFRDGEYAGLQEQARDGLLSLGRSQSGPAVVAALLHELKQPDPLIRERVASLLHQLGPLDAALIEAMLERLGDGAPNVGLIAGWTLGRLGRRYEPVVDRLLEQLEHERPRVRAHAAMALGEVGRPEPAVIQALLRHLDDEDPFARRWVALSLGDLASADREVVEALLQRAQDPEPDVREPALLALGAAGWGDRRVLQVLTGALTDGAPAIRRAAAEALGRLYIDDPEVIRALTERLSDGDGGVRACAVHTLGVVGWAESEVVEALIESLGDDDPVVRAAACQVLGWVDEVTPHLVELLIERLSDRSLDVRVTAAIALENLEAVVPVLIDAQLRKLGSPEALCQLLGANSPNDRTRGAFALLSLWRRGQGVAEAPPAVIKALQFRLKDQREVSVGWSFKVRDVAWRLLRIHAQATGRSLHPAPEPQEV